LAEHIENIEAIGYSHLDEGEEPTMEDFDWIASRVDREVESLLRTLGYGELAEIHRQFRKDDRPLRKE
jgi:hypothetical protein